MTTEVATTDPEQAHAIVAAAYADNRLRVSGSVEGFRLEQEQHDLGDVRFSRARSTLTTEYTLNPLGCATIGRMLAGTVGVTSEGTERRFGPGEVMHRQRVRDTSENGRAI